jgi:hypothetical protein
LMTTHHNPLDIFAKKQRVGQSDTDAIALPLMIHFDAAKRGQCTTAGANFLTRHLIIGAYIAARLKSKPMHDRITLAYAALKRASDRPTKRLDLTTGEYLAIAAALKVYLCAMPAFEVGTMNEACAVAVKAMQR